MAIESAGCFRRLASAGLLVLSGVLSLCGAASAQKDLVTTSSVIPLQHSTDWCQIYQVLNNPAGDTVFLDVCGAGGSGALYELTPGSTTFQTIVAGIDTSGTYYNEGMAMDAVGTLYITDRYSNTYHIYRVPYDSAKGYVFSASADSWPQMPLDSGFNGKGTLNVAFFNNKANDGSGLLFVSLEQANDIMVIPVNANGTVPTFPSGPDAGQPEFQYIISNLFAKVQPMQVDANGNLYFIENPYVDSDERVTGVFFIPAGDYTACMAASAAGTTDPTTPCLAGTESSLARIDSGNTEKFNGLALDAAGNVYVGDGDDQFGGTRNGTLMIPNESGSPVGVTAASFNFEDAEYLDPAPNNANPTIDPRGFIWSPTGTTSDWSPNGSGAISGTGNLILLQLGTDNLGSTPVGTPSAPGAVFYSFSGSVTPASFGGSEPGGANFSAGTTNPYPPLAGTTPAIPCTAGPSATGTATTYIAFSYCEYWPVLTPQGMNSVGDISGQLSMLDASNNVISGSTTYLSGVGEGPAAELLVPAQQTPLATGLMSPQQVAGDSVGNSYVADSGLKQVLMFAAGSTTATAGTPIGTGLTSPTGVAVDGAGNVYIADSGAGQVLEVPAVNGVLNAAGQTVLQTGLGKNLQLAVDNAQNVYVADPDNARVVKIYNPQMSMLVPVVNTPNTIGTFTKPTAVATDDEGNLYVADGANLDEIPFWGGQTNITSSLSAPVTGLAVDPSESVYVAQTGGIIRIPYETTTNGTGLQSNDAVQIDNSNNAGITAPSGIGMDALGNLYATAASYSTSSVGSSGVISTPVNTPNLLLLSGAFVNFGIVSQYTPSNPIDVNVYNIGNENLALTAPPTFSGTDSGDYAEEQDGLSPCDTSGATPITSGTACQLGVYADTQGLALSQASMAVTTTAINAPTTTATLESYSSDLLCRTLTTITLTPSTGLVYPGSTTINSSTVPDPAAPCAAGGVPQGGNLVLTLEPQAKGAAESTQTEQLPASGQYSFTLNGLSGGSYILYVAYDGDSVYGGSSSSRTFTLPVAQATPAITLGEPQGVSPISGTYYVLQGSTTSLQATVTSTVGSPTGSVQFLNGTTPADPTQNPVTLNGSGVATFVTTNLASGTYNLTAVYGSDTNFASVTSSVVTIVVTPPAALITASPTSITATPGTAVTSTLTITALEGYSPQMGVQLYCDDATLPKYSECTFDVPTVNLASASGTPQVPQTVHVTISSNIPVNEGQLRTGSSPIVFAGMFGLGLLGLAIRRRKKFNRSTLQVICLTLLFAGAAIGFAGCTNSGYTKTPPPIVVATPAGTYNVSIYTVDLVSGHTSSLPFTLTLKVN